MSHDVPPVTAFRGAELPHHDASGSADESGTSLRQIRDHRGLLLIAESGREIPFTPMRLFTVSEVPAGGRRAEHAHHTLEEFFICVNGACTITMDDGTTRHDIRLERPEQGLHKPPMVWVVLHSFTPDAMLLVLASDTWKDEDHIKDYDTFRRLAREAAE
jgi:mannose-6-phosphate isomerase-like protein (cupin superfamily)